MSLQGSLIISLETVSGRPIGDSIQFHLIPLSTGGESMRTPPIRSAGPVKCRVNGISCASLGTNYVIEVLSGKYQIWSFQQNVMPGEQTAPDVPLMVNPSKVRSINAPPFVSLESHLQTVLANSDVPAFTDRVSAQPLQGDRLYSALPAALKACLLNIARKAADRSSASVWNHVTALRRLEQDRIFAFVDSDCLPAVSASPQFRGAPNTLHTPMPGFDKKPSFKTADDDHAGLQLSFMQDPLTGQWAADLDIDEDAGFRHVFELLRNIFKGLTNPYQVRELLIRYEGPERNLDPGYEFVF